MAGLLDTDCDEIRSLVESIGFITTDPKNEQIKYVSEPFRRFAADQLRSLEAETQSLLIEDLLADPDSEQALARLPMYLDEAGKYDALLNFLSPEYFLKMLQVSQSFAALRQKAELGMNTARELDRHGDFIRFAVQRATMTQLDGAEVWRSEIEAKMALDDYDSALALAQSTVLKEDSLHLLAVIARAKREQGFAAETELSEQIRHLYEQIDKSSLGWKAVQIASDLIHVDFELAVDLIEKATEAGPGENAMDWALAKLSLAAMQISDDDSQPIDAVDRIKMRISDPGARNLTATASLLLGKCSPSEVMAEAEKLERASDRLFLYSLWTTENREREDALDVVESALNTAISTAEYAPNARVFRQLAMPLPFAADAARALALVGRFDSQQSTVEHLGPPRST